MTRRPKLSREQAIDELVRTRVLSTNLLEPLGIPFEAFLRLAQLPSGRADAVVESYIAQLSPKDGRKS